MRVPDCLTTTAQLQQCVVLLLKAFGQAALHCVAFDVQLICDRILVGADVSLSGELVGVQPHVGIGDETLQASPSIMFGGSGTVCRRVCTERSDVCHWWN